MIYNIYRVFSEFFSLRIACFFFKSLNLEAGLHSDKNSFDEQLQHLIDNFSIQFFRRIFLCLCYQNWFISSIVFKQSNFISFCFANNQRSKLTNSHRSHQCQLLMTIKNILHNYYISTSRVEYRGCSRLNSWSLYYY